MTTKEIELDDEQIIDYLRELCEEKLAETKESESYLKGFFDTINGDDRFTCDLGSSKIEATLVFLNKLSNR